MSALYEIIILKFINKRVNELGERSGQALFNMLPEGARNAVAGMLFDPFHRQWDDFQIKKWIRDHLVLDGTRVIAVFNNDQILWKR